MHAGLHNQASDLFDKTYRRWAARYSTFVRRWYAAEGNGTWASLAPATIAQRRSGKRRKKKRHKPGTAKTTTRGGATARTVTILRDTGVLYNALSIRGPGNKTVRIANGIVFGFHDRVPHPSGTGMSIAKLAKLHDGGGPNLPARPILIDPSPKLLHQMEKDVGRFFR